MFGSRLTMLCLRADFLRRCLDSHLIAPTVSESYFDFAKFLAGLFARVNRQMLKW